MTNSGLEYIGVVLSIFVYFLPFALYVRNHDTKWLWLYVVVAPALPIMFSIILN